ncbi:MAG: metallophosphoesterase [Opitutales bacterium]
MPLVCKKQYPDPRGYFVKADSKGHQFQSSKELSIIDERCLLVFDIHQNQVWLERILERESKAVDRLILGGDFFDPYPGEPHVSVKTMCRRLDALAAEWCERLTLLLGNHDVHYLVPDPLDSSGLHPYLQNLVQSPVPRASRWSGSSQQQVRRYFSEKLWRRARLFQVVNGWLVSHAGFSPDFWPESDSVDESLQKLDEQGREFFVRFPHAHLEFCRAGEARDETAVGTGGPFWQDFEDEFSDELPLPQLFGHSRPRDGQPDARKKGRSWCLDGGHSCYGILEKDGSLAIDRVV